MRNIKDLKIKSKEGLEVRNLKTFPSMEWGDDGGCEADIYYNGKFAVRVFQEGNGGCALDTERDDAILTAAKPSILAMIKRLDKTYEQYDWLKNKTVDTLDADDYEAIVNLFLEQYDFIKDAKKCFKNGFGTFVAVCKGALINTFHSTYDLAEPTVMSLIKNGVVKVDKDYDRLVILTTETVGNAF